MKALRRINTVPPKMTPQRMERAIRTDEHWGGSEERPVQGTMKDLFEGYSAPGFKEAVTKVWDALSQAISDDTVGHYDLPLVWVDNSGDGDYAQMQASMPVIGYVASPWKSERDLTDDRNAEGIDGLMAIGRALIDEASATILIARPLVKAQVKEWGDANANPHCI